MLTSIKSRASPGQAAVVQGPTVVGSGSYDTYVKVMFRHTHTHPTLQPPITAD